MDLIERLRAVGQEWVAARYPVLSAAEQATLAALPDNLAERVFAAAMRQAWREYIEPAVVEIERAEAEQLSALRYPE